MMVKKLILYSMILGGLFGSGEAIASVRQIHVELSYAGAAVSYNLYKDGEMVCVSNNPTASSMDCDVEIGPDPMTFVLTAVDANGVESPQSAPYILTPPAMDPVTGNYLPQASVTTSATTGEAPLLVSFDASGSSDFDGVITSYEWNFGDGTAATGELTDHTYTVPGSYTAQLTVIDDKGALAEQSILVTVSQAPPAANTTPTATFTAVQLQPDTSLIRFDASGSADPDGTIASYAWNFGDGASGEGKIVDHEFQSAGDYSVILTVTDNAGATKTDQMVITVVVPPKAANVLPVAEISASTQKQLLHFEWEYNGTDPALAGFRLYQNNHLVCEVADPSARQADCLDYVDNGQVRLWVTSFVSTGDESMASGPLVFDSTGLFGATGGEAPLAVHFSAGTSSDPDGTISEFVWDFGDGDVGNGIAVDHIYTIPGSYTVSLTVKDNSGGLSQATTTITVKNATPPVAVGASFSTLQDKSITATLTASDPEGAALTYRITKAATLGTASITNATTGVFTYVPKVGAFGKDSFSFKANDGTFDSNEAIVAVDIQKLNSAPQASDATLVGQEDTEVTGSLQATDSDNDPLTFTITTPPQHGTATIINAATGEVKYTPSPNFSGTDSFVYKANDGKQDSNQATVSISIAAVNDAPIAESLTLTTQEDIPVTGQLKGQDVDSNTLTYAIVTNGSKGVAVVADPGTGAITYTPQANANGQDSITYRVSDGQLSSEGVVTVLIEPVNDAPTTEAMTLTTPEDTPVTSQLTGADADGDQLNYSIVANGSEGKAVVDAATGKITYTPNANANGRDSVTFRVSDGQASVDGVLTISIEPVNDAPTTAAMTLTTREDTPVTGQLTGADADGDQLTYSIVTNGSKGKATVDAASGKITYAPNANANGQDSITFRVSDGTLSSDGVLTISIEPVNDAPTTAPITLSTKEDVAVIGQLIGHDIDGDQLTYSIVTNGSKGKAAVEAATGKISYTPDANANGQDSVTFRVSDGQASADGVVTISIEPVNDAPTTAAMTLTPREDTPVTGQLTGTDVDGDQLTYSIVTNGSKGKATVDAASGKITYAPNANVNGQDSVTFRVSDGTLSSDGVLTISIEPVNDAPTTAPITLSTKEDVAVIGQLIGHDIDGDQLTYSIVTNGSKGKAAVEAATGKISYTPDANANGQDSVTFRVSDGQASVDGVLTISIEPVNDAPTAEAMTLTTREDTPVTGQLTGADVDGDQLTYSIVTNGSKGKAAVDAANGKITYTPDANVNGQDSVTFRVSDGTLSSDGVLTISIEPVNDAPTTAPITVSTKEDVAVTGQLTGADVDGDQLTYSIVTNGSKGTAVITDASSGLFTYKPALNANGQDIITYRVSDGTLSADSTITVAIEPVDDPLIAGDDFAEVKRGGTVSIAVLANDFDPDELGLKLAVVAVTKPPFGTAKIVRGGVRYTADALFVGKMSFTYVVKASNGSTAIGIINVTVNP